MKQARIQASVQREMLYLRETSGDMLCLYAPGSPTRRSYRAVLEVAPINLALKAEDEQEAIIERFGALVRSLSFPLQVLVRNRRLDLLPYIRHLLIRPSEARQHPSTWYALASSVAELVQQIAAQRTLIERHIYVIIPASQGARRRGGIAPLFGKGRAHHVAETREQARQELALRAEALTQHLASCGLACQRLHNDDLARLFYRCLTPERAIAHPLSDKLLTAVGRPTSVKRRSGSAPRTQRVQSTGSGHHREASSVIEKAERPLPVPDLLHLADLLAPECIEVTSDALRVGQEYVCGLAVTACPREVSFDGWLAPLVLHDEVFDLTQNPEQFVQDPWGSVVASNAAIKVLKTQDATSAAAVAERFHLTRSEQQRLITFGSHEALVLAGGKRVIITIPASQHEHTLITTNPVEGAEQSNIGHAGADSPAAVESYQLALSQQKTVPLPQIEAPEHAADASHNGTFRQEQHV